MLRLRSIVPPLLLALALVVAPITGLAASEYGITADPSIDTPTETTTYEGKEYTVNSITPVTTDDTISVQTSVPDGASYEINFRGPENQLISSERKTGDASHTIEYYGSGEAGTYAITIQDEGSTQTVQPVVIQGYDIAVSTPDTVEQGDSVTIEATVSERSIEKHSAFDRVEIVIGNENIELREQMSQADDGTYTATVSTNDLETKSYNVYAVVRGDEEVRKRAEILGISDATSVEITTASTETPADSNPGGSPGTDPSDGTATPSTTPTPTPTVTQTPSETEPNVTATPRVTESPTASPPEGTSTTTPTMTDTDGVIEPSTATSTPTTDADGAGFGAIFAIVALLTALLARRHY
jgi:PGF-CTERM protein